MKNKFIVGIGLLTLIFWGCSSEEYTSAKLYLQQNDYPKAEEFLIKAMAVEAQNPEIPFQLGHYIYARDGRWQEMNDAFEKALAINPDAPILDGRPVKDFVEMARLQHWTDVYNKGIQMYNQARSLDGDDRKQGMRDVVPVFESGIIILTNESLNYTMLATCYFELGDEDKAIDFSMKAVELNPDDFNANIATGQILQRKGMISEALPYLKKAVELDPTNSLAIRNLAQAYYDVDDKDMSIKTYELAIEAATEIQAKADLHFNLGVLYNQVGDFDAAEAHFTTSLDMNPNDIEAIVGMAQTFESNEKWRKAEKFYKELTMLDPDNPAHFKGMARVLLKQGNQDDAMRYYEKAKKLE